MQNMFCNLNENINKATIYTQANNEFQTDL